MYGNEENQRTPKVIEALRGRRAVQVVTANIHSLVVLDTSVTVDKLAH